MSTLSTVVLVGAAIGTALIAGLFYAYSCSVNPGLHRLSNIAYLTAMQSINRAILNPVFFASFMGTLVLLPLSAWLQHDQPNSVRFWLLLIATLVYGTGVFGLTVLGNVPLNEVLDSVDLQTASPEAIATIRTQFEQPWNRFHSIRTIASIITEVLVSVALLNPKVS